MSAQNISLRPYLLRAFHEWCTDEGLTPHLMVDVDETVRIPQAYVRDGSITLNISYEATGDLLITAELVRFQARFGGVAQWIEVPVERVSAIFARENGEGMAFEVLTKPTAEETPSQDGQGLGEKSPSSASASRKPQLRIVK